MRRVVKQIGLMASLIGLIPTLSLGQSPSTSVGGPSTEGGDIRFNSGAFQAALAGDGLGTLALDNSSLGEAASSFGFSAKSDEANVFLIGSLYSEALAFLRSGDRALAVDRLEAIEQQLISLGVSSPLYGLISRVKTLTGGNDHSKDILVEMLSVAQPFLDEHFASRSDDFLVLFQTGSWLGDLGLAASAGRIDLLRQEAQLSYVQAEMERLDAPEVVVESLAEISKLIAKDEISPRDANSILDQIKQIQRVLS